MASLPLWAKLFGGARKHRDGERFVRPCLELLEGRELLSAGALDPTFNPGGPVPGIELIPNALGYSVAIQSDGKILAGGEANPIFAVPGVGGGGAFGEYSGGFVPGRFNTDGSPDLSFQAGLLPTAFALQSDGKIVTTTQGLPNQRQILLQRFNADGTLDTSFGTSGTVTLTLGNDIDYGSSVAVQSDGKILVVGSESGDVPDASSPYGYDFVTGYFLARFNTDGSADATFDASGARPGLVENFGAVPPPPGGLSYENLSLSYNLAVQPDGGILIGANFVNSGALVVRYQPDGSLDSGFGQGGYAYVGQGAFFLESMAVQPDGKVVLGGVMGGEAAGQMGDSLFTLKRLDTDGGLDASFGVGGVSATDFGANWADVHALAVQSDGKIIAVGSMQSSYGPALVTVACYEPDGSLDANFGTGGEVVLPNVVGEGEGVALEPDGGIVVVGEAGALGTAASAIAYYGTAHTLLARLTPDLGPATSPPTPPVQQGGGAPTQPPPSANSPGPVGGTVPPPPPVVAAPPPTIGTPPPVVAPLPPLGTDANDGLPPGTALAIVQAGSQLPTTPLQAADSMPQSISSTSADSVTVPPSSSDAVGAPPNAVIFATGADAGPPDSSPDPIAEGTNDVLDAASANFLD